MLCFIGSEYICYNIYEIIVFLGNVVNVKLCIIYTLWLGDDLMGKQNEIFRKMHPEQFSDSKIIKKEIWIEIFRFLF